MKNKFVDTIFKFAFVYSLTFLIWIVPTIFSTYTNIGPFGLPKDDMISYNFMFVITNLSAFSISLYSLIIIRKNKQVSFLTLSLISFLSVLGTIAGEWITGYIGLGNYIPVAFFASPFLVVLISYFYLKSTIDSK